MTRRIGFSLLLLAVLILFAATGPALAQSLPADIDRILRRGTLVVALTETDVPPFHVFANGTLSGVDVDLAKGLAQSLGVGVTFDRSAKSFDAVVEAVARGQADIGISKLSRTLKRARTVRFSPPYLTLRHALAFNRVWLARATRDQPLAEVIRSFDGRLGVLAKTSYVEYAHRLFPRADIVEFPAWTDAVASLAEGDIAALYRDEFEIRRLVNESPELALHLKTAFLTDTKDHLCMAVNPSDTQLLHLAEIYIEDMNPRLTVESVLNRLEMAAKREVRP